MKTHAFILMVVGLVSGGCASTPTKKPLRAQAEAPASGERVDDDASNCDFNLTMCVRPAPPAQPQP